MKDLARIQTRLNDIHSVLPILGALRTISLGSWQLAQKQQAATQQYEPRLLQMIPWLLPLLPAGQQIELNVSPQSGWRVALAVGNERGLCGRFNATIADHTEQYLARQQVAGQQVELWALGGRLYRLAGAGFTVPIISIQSGLNYSQNKTVGLFKLLHNNRRLLYNNWGVSQGQSLR